MPPSSGSDDGFGVERVEVLGPPPKTGAPPPPSSAETLVQLQQWLSATARMALHHERQGRGAVVLEAYDAAVHALASLAKASGSLSAVLLLATVLISAPHRTLPSRPSAAIAQLLHAVRQQVCYNRRLVSPAKRMHSPTHLSLQIARQGVVQALADQASSRRIFAGVAVSSVDPKKLVPLPTTFEPSLSAPAGVVFSNGNTTVASTSAGGGSHSYALCSAGPFTEGKATWEFRLDEDTNSQVSLIKALNPYHRAYYSAHSFFGQHIRYYCYSFAFRQCSCFGAATWPVSTINYENSREMWMLRAYNGHRYANGSNIGRFLRIAMARYSRVFNLSVHFFCV